ncbi:riboflavin synthase [Cephaloticoccus primus]|uniref:riboflavin synthase n=1 Tax=Cephaloticoccus primus TaxID=1548207 RepID=UPI0008383B48|nr:riboflavin synthase [Cephaloticoccus primus]
MFTGLVEEKGRLLAFSRAASAEVDASSGAVSEGSWHLTLAARRVLSDAALGDSIAVNGCCLTVVAIDRDAGTLTFDVLEETRRLTNFAALSGVPASGANAGAGGERRNGQGEREERHLNLERSLRADARLGGHFVTGHIDGVGRVVSLTRHGADYRLEVSLPEDEAQRGPIVHKGSIAIDGVSLTVAEVDDGRLAVWLIPTTLAETNLGEKRPGDPVNLEYDLLGKYAAKILGDSRRGVSGSSSGADAQVVELAALDGADFAQG